jgi:hypothetical protein
MGAYNILITVIQCQNCHLFYKAGIQFKFGDTWQFEYKVGDKIAWGRNDIGKPGLPKVKAYGVAVSAACPYCGYCNEEEYDVNMEKDVIKNVTPLSNLLDYNYNEDGNFFVYAKSN